jgi:hypothetical protein
MPKRRDRSKPDIHKIKTHRTTTGFTTSCGSYLQHVLQNQSEPEKHVEFPRRCFLETV